MTTESLLRLAVGTVLESGVRKGGKEGGGKQGRRERED